VNKIVSEDVGEFYHHYPKVAAVITANAKGRENAMAAAWHSAISYKPPIYGVAISPKRFTYQLIVDSKEFGVNFLPFEAVELIAEVGGSGGQDVDKFQRFNIAKGKPIKTGVPILEAAYAAYECKLIDDRGYGNHRWLVGEVVAVHIMEGALASEQVLDLNKVNPILYLGQDMYCTTAKDTEKRLERVVYGKIA